MSEDGNDRVVYFARWSFNRTRCGHVTGMGYIVVLQLRVCASSGIRSKTACIQLGLE